MPGPAHDKIHKSALGFFWEQKRVPTKKLCDKDFAERSGELSGAICLKTPVLPGGDR